MEGARVWNFCMETHKAARLHHDIWPGRNELQKATKGRFGLHSQSIQMIVHAFLANIDTTRQLRQTHPQMKMRYPYKEKKFYPISWPMQAVSKENGRVVLPMGRGRTSLVLPLDLPAISRSCTLVWNNGYELHVCVEIEQQATAPGDVHATVDLGEIHLAAVTTNTGKAMIVTGRGIRTLKRQRTMQLRSITKTQARCIKYSRRWKKLQHAKNKQSNHAEQRIRNQRHQATRKVMTSAESKRLALSSLAILMLSVIGRTGVTTTNGCPCGNMARISTTSPTKANKPTCRASLAPNEEHEASVLPVGINTSQKTGNGTARCAGSLDIETL